MFKHFSIPSLAFHEAIIRPAFADVIPAGFPFQGLLNEFTLMDNVPSKRPIVDIRRQANILQRRDASCDIIYKKVFGAEVRFVTTDEIYGATQFCRNEFYQGALKDWRAGDPIFETNILPFFQDAINTDISSNAYFGDVERPALATDTWSTNIFDGVFKWIGKYIAAGIIPSTQSMAIADGQSYTGSSGATAAYTLISTMYERRPILMTSIPDSDQAFYVDKEIADGYENYLIATSTTNGNISLLENGRKKLFYKGIEILPVLIWGPIIAQVKGAAGHAAVLTMRTNFIFATDKDYGEGEDGKSALEIWYEKKDMKLYYRVFLKAGTQIALPEFIVVAMSEW